MSKPPYEYWPIVHRRRLELPGKAFLAFWIGVNIEHYEIDKPSPSSVVPATAQFVPDALNYGWRDYGLRVGIWRLMGLLDKYGIRASVLLNSDVCRLYPEVIDEGNKRNWVWLSHGKNNSVLQTGMPLEEERHYLAKMVKTIRESTGRQPRGWLGPALTETFNTPDLLAEIGIEYILDWCNDDQPYPMRVRQGRMISLPYSIEINDIPIFVTKGLSAREFYQMVVDQFDLLYAEGEQSARVMCLAIHPFISNLPFRHKYLDKALQYITSHDKVWIATSDEIADWYYQNYYDQALADIDAYCGRVRNSRLDSKPIAAEPEELQS